KPSSGSDRPSAAAGGHGGLSEGVRGRVGGGAAAMAATCLRRAAAAAAATAASASSAGGSCFVLLEEKDAEPPISDAEVARMWRRFAQNLNFNGTGAVIASPGVTPALPGSLRYEGYAFDWMRDGALSMLALQHLASSELPGLDLGGRAPVADFARGALRAYARWVRRTQGSSAVDAKVEPKWRIDAGEPWAGGWCRPQSDGPALRAQALARFARGLAEPEERPFLWNLIKSDLDWVASPDSVALESCDLWEETTDSNFLWNRAMMRSALLEGQSLATRMGDASRAQAYLEAAERIIGDPLSDHVMEEADGGFITECPASGGGSSCRDYEKGVDGAAILSLVHGVPLAPRTSAAVARTVSEYNRVFCGAYPVNAEDSQQGVPGVLYGRYAKDEYGGGNPWVLITAALASLFYQAALEVRDGHPLSMEEVVAWRDAVGSAAFAGSAEEFLAAGDSVLHRLRHHIRPADDWHLYEQIDKVTGLQYNARDLTWSYAELLEAMVRRRRVVARHHWLRGGQGWADGLVGPLAPRRGLVSSDAAGERYGEAAFAPASGRLLGPGQLAAAGAIACLTAAAVVGAYGACQRSPRTWTWAGPWAPPDDGQASRGGPGLLELSPVRRP
ncbi:unnamed protein product, partial [Prorocentrum cordatum]